MSHTNPSVLLTKSHNELLQIFLEEYMKLQNSMEERYQKKLIEVSSLVFAKWSGTALLADTLLTPQKLVKHTLKHHTKYDKEEFAYIMQINQEQTKKPKYKFVLQNYSLENHVLIADLYKLVEFFKPTQELRKGKFLTEEASWQIAQEVSRQELFYIEYLTRLAWELNLIEYMPSIYVEKAQAILEFEKFFQRNPSYILLELAKGACEIAADQCMICMQLDYGQITGEFFEKYLYGAHETKELYIAFYGLLDMDISKLWYQKAEELTEEEMQIASSFGFTSFIFDKWFLFPMMHFFRFIECVSFAELDFLQMINMMMNVIALGRNLSPEIFVGCHYYSISKIGQSIFYDEVVELEKYTMKKEIDFQEILDIVKQQNQKNFMERNVVFQKRVPVAILKVSYQNELTIWKRLEVVLETNLHEFCQDICSVLVDAEISDYVLMIADENDYPMYYASMESRRSVNQTNQKTLADLDLDCNTKCLLTPYPRGEVLLLEVEGISFNQPNIIYPRVVMQSKKMTELEREEIEDWF